MNNYNKNNSAKIIVIIVIVVFFIKVVPYLAKNIKFDKLFEDKTYRLISSNSNKTFEELATKQDDMGTKLMKSVSEKLESLGVEVTKIVVTSIDVNEDVKQSMRERTAIKMKATSTSNEEADIYTKINKAEAMKDLANNPSSNGATIMGMNMGNMFSAEMKDNSNNNNQTE